MGKLFVLGGAFVFCFFSCFFCMVFLLVCIFAACVVAAQGDVVELNEWNLDEVSNSKDRWLLVFYVSWCGFCHQTKELLKGMRSTFKIGQVDCTKRMRMCSHFGFIQWPSIVVVKGNDMWNFQPDALKDERSLREFVLNTTKMPPDTLFANPGRVALIGLRVKGELMLVLEDIREMWKSQFDAVLMIVGIGIVIGFSVSLVLRRWNEKTKKD